MWEILTLVTGDTQVLFHKSQTSLNLDCSIGPGQARLKCLMKGGMRHMISSKHLSQLEEGINGSSFQTSCEGLSFF